VCFHARFTCFFCFSSSSPPKAPTFDPNQSTIGSESFLQNCQTLLSGESVCLIPCPTPVLNGVKGARRRRRLGGPPGFLQDRGWRTPLPSYSRRGRDTPLIPGLAPNISFTRHPNFFRRFAPISQKTIHFPINLYAITTMCKFFLYLFSGFEGRIVNCVMVLIRF